MARREVVTLWATRKSIDAGYHPPELLTAWDEYSIDENLEGWHADCQRSMAAVGNDLDQFRYITLRIDESVLDEAFFHTVTADVDAAPTSAPGTGASVPPPVQHTETAQGAPTQTVGAEGETL